MSDRAAHLEELRKISGDRDLETLESRTGLNLGSEKLKSLPLGACDLTGLVDLRLYGNQLSSLPPEISQLTGLTHLSLYDNAISFLPPELSHLTGLERLGLSGNQLSSLPPEISHLTALTLLALADNSVEELPLQITSLKNLQELHIEREGRMATKRAPRDITALPSWNNDTRPYCDITMTFAEALQKLELY